MEKLLLQFIKKKDVSKFSANLPKPLTKTNVKSVQNLLYTNLDDPDLFDFSSKLVAKWDKRSRRIGDEIFAGFYKTHQDKMQRFLVQQAESKDWQIREIAACWISVVLFHNFKMCLSWCAKHVNGDSSVEFKRAIAVATKYCVQQRKVEQFEPLIKMIEPLLTDNSEYVRKNFGPFVIGDGFLRVYPDESLPFLTNWSKTDDEVVLWNVARALGSSGGVKLWPKSTSILKSLATDDRRFVWKSVSTTIQYLAKRQPDDIDAMLKTWSGSEFDNIKNDLEPRLKS